MKKYAPLATLVAVVLLGAGLLVANMLSNPANQTTAAPAPSAAAAAAPGEPAAAEPAPAEPAPVEPAVVEKAYTGRSAGNEVTVAIAVKNGKAVAYACDGKKIEAWMEGALAGDQLTLKGKSSSLSASVSEKATLGSITVNGAEWPFSAKGVQAPAGLYEGRGVLKGVAARVGWIVEDNGKVTGTANVNGEPQPAPPIDPAAPTAITVDGNTITVSPISGDATVVAR
jgi:hypothetical protein